MLTDEEKREIEAECRHYAEKCGAAIEALRIVQRRRGWVSDESLRAVADFLGMSADELEGVASFYSQIFRQPVGRHVIRVCTGVSCWIAGSKRLREQLAERLGIEEGKSTVDGRFTLLPTSCLGACDRGPVMMVDDDLHDRLKQDKLVTILANYE